MNSYFSKRSTYYLLSGNLSDRNLTELNECTLEPGGYFIVNGSENFLHSLDFIVNFILIYFIVYL
ncbi:MAG: hypothetical protein GY938_09015 [Ketobacter sp.]|nr:hypothetical protein [Ketobacter sp.]